MMSGQLAIAPALMMQWANAAVAQELETPRSPHSSFPAPIEAVAQTSPAPVQITEVRLETSEAGLQIQLETSAGELPTPTSSVAGNALVITVPNAVLALSTGDELIQFEPADRIALVQVTELPGAQVQIVITGAEAPPTAEISSATAELTVSIAPGLPGSAATDDEAIQLAVTGEQAGSDYRAPTAATATRTESPIEDIPQSIQVIPRQLIEDEQATGIEDVLDNVAGVNYFGNDDGRGTRFTIRGFGAGGSPVLRDGFRVFNSGNNAAAPEIANLERIEVLKGPASVLYGEADPGGVINLVTKQPLSEPFYSAQIQVGNRGLMSPSLDLTGPLTADGSVRYRLNALVRREESFRDLDNSFNRSFIAPTLAWDISDRTDLTVSLEYIEDNDPADFGLLAVGDGVADIPLDRVLNNPDDTVEKEYLSVGYTLEHRFNDNWQLRNEFRYVADNFNFGTLAVPAFFNEPSGLLTRAISTQNNERDNYSLYTNVQGRFNTGAIEHNLLFGVDLSREEDRLGGRGGLSPQFNPEFFSTIDIFDPDYSLTAPDVDDAPVTFIRDTNADRLGIYLQDQIYLLDNLIVLAGLRYDTVDQETTGWTLTPFGDNVTETSQNDDAVTPRIGIVYQPTETIALYANYAQSFTPNTETDVDGLPLEPETGDGFEVGIKADLIPNRLSATLAYFDITRQNVATADPNDPLAAASIATGEQRSRGVDLDISGEILPGWNIIASYAYIDAEITEDNTLEVGNRLASVPEHSASLWTTYEIQSGDLEGLSFGLGFNFVGERQGDLDNSFAVDSYFLTAAAASYRRDNWRVQLNIDNLFDVDYIESAGGGRARGIFPGDPLTVRGSFSVTF
ncbi:MAG: TonB-dependent receptor [Cyanobacteria bacterium P01_H01_bin.162]